MVEQLPGHRSCDRSLRLPLFGLPCISTTVCFLGALAAVVGIDLAFGTCFAALLASNWAFFSARRACLAACFAALSEPSLQQQVDDELQPVKPVQLLQLPSEPY